MPISFMHFLQPIANRFAARVTAEEYEFDLPWCSVTRYLQTAFQYNCTTKGT